MPSENFPKPFGITTVQKILSEWIIKLYKNLIEFIMCQCLLKRNKNGPVYIRTNNKCRSDTSTTKVK